tara:strand:- start:4565 stop:4702 length:138 start_codon:yes stop_codon:yes gene_type:complete
MGMNWVRTDRLTEDPWKEDLNELKRVKKQGERHKKRKLILNFLFY